MHINPEAKQRVVSNLPDSLHIHLTHIPQAEQKRRLVASDVTSRHQHVKCLFRAFWRLIFGATINSGSYFFIIKSVLIFNFQNFSFCSSLRAVIVELCCYIFIFHCNLRLCSSQLVSILALLLIYLTFYIKLFVILMCSISIRFSFIINCMFIIMLNE